MLEAYGISDQGCVRSNNEDYFLLAPTLGLFVVADGMGGAQAGEFASKLAADTVAEMVWRNGQPSPDSLQSAFEEANRRVMSAASDDPTLQGMGTTLVAAQEIGEDLHIISVGDSRAYSLVEGRLELVTEDQTWVNEIGRRLGIPEPALKTHQMRHVLTMAIGVSGNLRINSYKIPIHQNLQVLMCSDGLHGVLDNNFISQVLSSGRTLESKCHYLVEEARKAGGPDNITVVLLGSRQP
jgi:serine/threonine protein phosphatase PrpC